MKYVYIITDNYIILNYRISKLLKLRSKFKIILIARKKKDITSRHPDDILLPRYPNVFGIFRKIGMNSLANTLGDLYYFPNINILFVKKAVQFIEKDISNKKKTEVKILTTSPSHEIAMVGLLMKKKFREITWINELQDLWTFDEFYFHRFSKFTKPRIRKLERKIFKYADFTITTNEYAKDVLCNVYSVSEEKIIPIHHPFDRSDFKSGLNRNDLKTEDGTDKAIKLAFVGSLIKEPKVPGHQLLREIKKCSEKYNLKIELQLYGEKLKDSDRIGFNNTFHISEFGKLSHSTAFERAAKADYLLLLLGDVPNTKVIMHGKLSHYLILQLPIIAFVPEDSFAAKVIRDTGTGFVIGTDVSWDDELFNIVSGKYKPPENNLSEIEKYSVGVFLEKYTTLLTE